MQNHTFDQTHLPCSICPLFFLADDLHECGSCGDLICSACPAFACSCIDEGLMQELRTELHQTAIELADLVMIEKLMGTDALTHQQQSRRSLLSEIATSLTNEICRMDEVKCGETYPQDREC